MKSPFLKHQSGNVLFLILIAVALFAALSYSVANILRSGNPEMITEERAKILANEILSQARTFRQGIQMLRVSNGCSDTGVSFETPALSGYTHSPIVADKCKLFHQSGGGLVYVPPPEEVLDMGYSPAPALRGQWFFPADTCVPEIGTAPAGTGCNSDSADNEAIIAVLPFIRKNICVQINKNLGVNNPGGNPPVETSNAWPAGNTKFNGGQNDTERLDQDGFMAGCFEGSATNTPPTGTYHFFQVLMPR